MSFLNRYIFNCNLPITKKEELILGYKVRYVYSDLLGTLDGLE